jgi:hypothetical protein
VKKLIGTIVVLLVFLAGQAIAADIYFSWKANNPPLDGYRLYMDGGTFIKEIAPEATTVSVPAPIDGNPHNFWLTAYYIDEESGRSTIVTWQMLIGVRNFQQVFPTVP